MGLCAAKENAPVVKKKLDARTMYYDENGMLRHGKARSTAEDRESELRRVLSADSSIDEPGKVWFVVEGSWLKAWLSYVRTSKGVSPRPGPIANKSLLVVKPGDVHARRDLTSAAHSKTPDYRRVCGAVWAIYLEAYGGGPAISVTSEEGHSLDDVGRWVIDMEAPPLPAAEPVDEVATAAAVSGEMEVDNPVFSGKDSLLAAGGADAPDMRPLSVPAPAPAAAKPKNITSWLLGDDEEPAPTPRDPQPFAAVAAPPMAAAAHHAVDAPAPVTPGLPPPAMSMDFAMTSPQHPEDHTPNVSPPPRKSLTSWLLGEEEEGATV